MKKLVLRSAIISFAVNAVMCAINWILALKTGGIIGITTHGGEYTAQYGFGVIVEKFYPMTSFVEPGWTSTQINPEPISFVITLLAVFAIALLISKIMAKKKA